MRAARCPYCSWRSDPPLHDEVPLLLHAAMQLQEHLIRKHWLTELDATDVADLWAAVTASQAEA